MVRKKSTAEEIAKDAVASFTGMAVMGETAKLVPAAGAPAVATGYRAMGLAASSMTVKAAKGVLDGLDDLGRATEWKRKKRR